MSHIRREFIKTLFQKRTYIGWAGLFVVPFLVTLAVRFSSGGRRGGDGGALLIQSMRSNGLFVTVVALMVLSTFFLPLFASMAGSYTLAGEAERGTLRTTLMQPARRGALLMAKWLVANLYIALGLLFMGIAAIIAGGAVFGLHPLQLLSGGTVSVGHGLGLILLSYLYILLGMAAVVSLAVLFSSLTDSSLTAVAAGLVLVIVMEVLGSFSVFDFLKPYLFTSHFDAWQGFLRSPVPWDPIWKGLVAFAAWIAGTMGLAYVVFGRKDILS